jgi:hypothetical protein
MFRKFCLIVTCVLSGYVASAQVGAGTLNGKITEKGSSEGVAFANIVIQRGSQQITGGSTDFDGNFSIKPISPGSYDLLVTSVGYKPVKITGIEINANKITFQNIAMETTAIDITEFEVIEYEVPLITKDGGPSGGTVNREELARMPGRSATAIAATVGGVQTNSDGEISIRGAREENTFYYIDGVKMRGTTRLPKAAIQEVSVLTGGIPANYGDVTGGVISITTRGATSIWFGSVDVLTSGIRAGGNNIGLDPYATNQIEGVISGPLMFRKDSTGKKVDPLLGFFLAGNYRNDQDTRPSAVGNVYINDDARERLLADPIQFSFTDGIIGAGEGVVIDNGVVTPGFAYINPASLGIYNASFLREEDWTVEKARRNSKVQGINLSTRLDIATAPTVDLAVGGRFDYVDAANYSFNNSFLNYNNNSVSQNMTYSVWGRFTQRFKQSQESTSNIRNAFYSIQADYIKRDNKTFDRTHRDNHFNYGYVGAFDVTTLPNYSFSDTLNGVFIHDGFRQTGVTFDPSDVNADLAAVNSSLFDFYNQNGLTMRSRDEIRVANGLLNGDAVPSVYNLWNGVGAPANTYQLFEQSQFRVTATGSVDVGKHAVSLGFEYEQLTERGYGLSPVALWTIARQRTNFHIEEIDYNNLLSNQFIDGNYYYTYGRLVGDDQSFFDANLRAKLGLPINGTDYINVDGLDPTIMTLDMFSADELLNQGNSLVNYYGFDHTGKRLSRNASFDDFFNQEVDGQKTRSIGAFQPIYISGFIMDKFAFDDMIFNVGLRIDRYDANQFVLKDEYIVGESFRVGNNPTFNTHPGNIGDDFAMYVDRFDNPTEIRGYRDGDIWFNADGIEIADPRILRTSTGITPYLVNPEEVGENLSSRAFEDYKPQINVMPRISFSFPISDEATFFAHYDILTQRPMGNNRLDPIDYLYIQNRNNIINNPNLRPTQTTDYELGFQQILTRSSSLKIAAFYRATRNELNVRNIIEAYPRQYITYSNIDFGTIKGLTLTYDLRRTGNISLRANYTLQFASATGSNANSGVNLANSGEPALRVINPTDRDQRHVFILAFDYRYQRGSKYNGPVVGGKQILADAGLNLVGNLGSGTPYSKQRIATSAVPISGGSGTPSLLGQINGSRMPSQFTINVQLDKSFIVTLKKEEGEKVKTANLNVYLLVNNLLNTQNIINVYRFTGNPDDDGYLNAAQFQAQIREQFDETSYREMYAARANSPFNYGLARTIQLGVRFDF